MKLTLTIFLISIVVLAGVVPSIVQAEPASGKNPDYFVFKGGYYYPSERIRLDEFSDTDFDRRKGFNGEVAVGHYYVPLFGTELGIGYFESRRFPGVGPGRTRVEAVPILLSARLYLPLGPIEPYGEVGIGAYFSKLEIQSTLGTSTFREVDFGPHAGVGVNINFTDTFYVGVEGRYRKVEPEFDSRSVRLDGYTATANIGFRY